MIDDLRPYPKYKDSGVPWLGEVPEHWEVARNGRLFAERREVGFPDLPVLEVSLRTGVQVRNADAAVRKQALGDLSVYKRARAGDIAYNMMRMWQGAVGVAPLDGLVSPAYVVARPSPEADSRYYEYLFRTPAYMGEVNNYSRGIVADRNRLYWNEFKDVRSPVPPHEEQMLVVRFLRVMDQRIARYIRAKKKLIALLNEQKQAIIHRAVTRGLDPYARLKASGVEWLGEVPEHWTLKRFKFVASVATGQVDPKHHELRNRILLAPNHIVSGTGRITRLETASEQGAESGKYEVRKGDIVYSKIRPALRKAAVAPLNCLCSADMYPISVGSELRTEFALLLLLSEPFTRYAVDCSLRVAMPKVNREALGGSWLWYPSLQEQDTILEMVKEAGEPLDAATDRANRAADLLRELRMRLIADVTRGRLDLRETAARLPTDEPADELSEIGDTEEDTGDESTAEMETLDIEE